MQTLPLIVIATTLAILPLQRLTSLQGLISPAWNATDLLLLLAVIFLYGFYFYTNQKLSLPSLIVAGLVSLLLLIVFQIGLQSSVGIATTARFLIITWAVPILVSLRTVYGRTIPLFILAALMTLHAQWALLQFVLQDDLGLVLIGETNLASSIAGIAKFTSGADKLVRPYGPFPHTNSLAGSLVLGLIAVVALGTAHPGARRASIPIAGILTLVIVAAFSRAALLSLVTLLVAVALLYRRSSSSTVAHPTVFLRVISIFTAIALIVFTPLWHARLTDIEDRGIEERESQAATALSLIRRQPVWHGIGLGNYPAVLQSRLDQMGIAYESWHITPVHSAPLLLIIELGLLATLALFIALIVWLARHASNNLVLLISVVPLILFDHYFLTQTAPLVLLLLAALLLPAQQKFPVQRIPM